MKRINLKQTARQILEDNQYMTLATVNPDGRAWVSPVVYAPDSNINLYFLSLPESRHSRNIADRPLVSAAVFDSGQACGAGVGLQIEGQVRPVPAEYSLRALKWYFGRKWPYPGDNLAVKGFKKFVKGKIYRFYKFVPTSVWMNDPRKEKDERVLIRAF